MKKLLAFTVLGLLWSGSAYAECIEGDCKNGEGTYKFPGGEQYSGTWKNNKMHGKGIFKWSDGKVIEGKWIEGDYVK